MHYLSNMSSILQNYCYSLELSEEQLNCLEKCWLDSLNTIHYAKEFFGENHTVVMNVDKKAYLSALAISENIVVTCDSSSMISEAALTGKPVYIANILPRKNDIRFQRFRNLFRELNITRNLGEDMETWT